MCFFKKKKKKVTEKKEVFFRYLCNKLFNIEQEKNEVCEEAIQEAALLMAPLTSQGSIDLFAFEEQGVPLKEWIDAATRITLKTMIADMLEGDDAMANIFLSEYKEAFDEYQKTLKKVTNAGENS